MGHTLVIPKKHYVDIFDIPEDQLSQVHKVTKQVSSQLKKPLNADGISIIQQNGKAAGQDIFHFMCMWFQDLKGRNCQVLAALKRLKERNLTVTAKKIKQQLKKT